VHALLEQAGKKNLTRIVKSTKFYVSRKLQ
jgi:hypothetical protein